MLRSMFTAISALNLHQNYLDVVANNLANANTTGFKASRVLFHDQFSQLMNPGASPSSTLGGTNPIQIGLGLQLGFISPIFTQGMLQSTGRNMDLALQGDGFFIYGRGTQRNYSREGSIAMDSEGYLVNSSTGLRLQGWQADTAGNLDFNIPIGDIRLNASRTLARQTATVNYGGNLSADTAIGGSVTTTMGVYDSLGVLHTASVQFTRTAANTWTWQVTAPAGAAGQGTLVFDGDGHYVSNTVGTAVSIPASPGANPINNLNLNLSATTMLSGSSSITVQSQDGLPTGTVSDVYISPNDGAIILVYSNGMREKVAQIALARFNNPAGLIHVGHTSFQQGLNSGEPEIGLPGSGGRGLVAAGYLEASNVDMAQEFTNMILAQRGFQASSRVITTSDEILQELVNLKR